MANAEAKKPTTAVAPAAPVKRGKKKAVKHVATGRAYIHATYNNTNTVLFAVASSTASATTTLFVITNTGSVGIGTAAPATVLDVNGYARVFQTSTTTACSSAIAGSIFFNQANGNFWGCDGTNWLRLNN